MDAEVWKDKGNAEVLAHNFEKAAEFYTEAIRLYKREPKYYTNRALCYLKLKKFADCITDCTIAIDLDSSIVKAFYRRMQAYQSSGNWKEALDDCEQVLKLQPNNKEARRNVGKLTQKVDKVKKLAQFLRTDIFPAFRLNQ